MAAFEDLNFEYFCEDNSGRSKKISFSEKIKGGDLGPRAPPLEPLLEAIFSL